MSDSALWEFMKTLNYNDNTLDIFRIIATVQVFLGHMVTHFAMPGLSVDAVYFVRGVPILFALCGFLAAKSLDEKPPIIQYLKQRAIRIIPAFWACIIINTILIAVLYETVPTVKQGVIYLFTQFFGLNFYTGDWLRDYGVGTPNGVLWTISVQIQFFVLAPLFKKILAKKNLWFGLSAILGLTFVSILCNRLEPYLPTLVYKLINVTVLPYAYFLVFGMVVWEHRDAIIPFLTRFKWVLAVAYVAWKFAEIYLSFPHVLDGVLYNTVTTLLLAGVLFGFSFMRKWRAPIDLTYGFYLYHMIIINIVVELGYTSAGWLLTLLIAATTILCAWLSQVLVEKPCVKLLKKR